MLLSLVNFVYYLNEAEFLEYFQVIDIKYMENSFDDPIVPFVEIGKVYPYK